MKRAFYKQQADQRANKPPLYSDRTRRNQPTIFSTVMKIPRPFRHQHGVCMHLKLRIDCLSQIDLNYPRPQLLSQRASVRRPSAALCPHMASICSSQRCFTLCNLQQQVRLGQGGSLWTQFQDLLRSLGAAGSPVFVKYYQPLIQLLSHCSNNQAVPQTARLINVDSSHVDETTLNSAVKGPVCRI